MGIFKQETPIQTQFLQPPLISLITLELFQSTQMKNFIWDNTKVASGESVVINMLLASFQP